MIETIFDASNIDPQSESNLLLPFCSGFERRRAELFLKSLIVLQSSFFNLLRELFLDGNQLEAEGAIALLTQLAEAAVTEGFERQRVAQEKILAAELALQGIFVSLNSPFLCIALIMQIYGAT